jgi:hypothetical protein
MNAIPFPEALARQVIAERTEELRRGRPFRRHARTAVLLRRLAQRLDPQLRPVPAPQCSASRTRAPRPWSAVARSARSARSAESR